MLFIVLEGIDGAGTTTQTRLLVEHLCRSGRTAIATAEPTDGEFGLLIRRILRGEVSARSEAEMALLFALDRLEHCRLVIGPSVRAGKIVVCDRYYLSSLAYQALEAEMRWVREVNRAARVPDLTILIDIDPRVSLKRKTGQAERYERAELLDRVRANYFRAAEMLKEEGERIEVLDGTLSVEQVQERIRSLCGFGLDRRR